MTNNNIKNIIAALKNQSSIEDSNKNIIAGICFMAIKKDGFDYISLIDPCEDFNLSERLIYIDSSGNLLVGIDDDSIYSIFKSIFPKNIGDCQEVEIDNNLNTINLIYNNRCLSFDIS